MQSYKQELKRNIMQSNLRISLAPSCKD